MCEHSSRYHLWPFYGLAEILDEEGKNADEGEVGELVGTSFWSYGTPFIRYKTSDIARKGKTSCEKCGRQFQLLEGIEGRTQDYVITEDGGLVSLTALIFAQHFQAFGAIENMQLYQASAGEVVVKIVPTKAFSEKDAREIREKMESAVGGRISVQVQLVERIPRTSRGKHKFLVQELDIRYGE